MPNGVSGEIRVKVEYEEPGREPRRARVAEGKELPSGYVPLSREEKEGIIAQFKGTKYQEQSLGIFKKYLPALTGMFSLYSIAKSSQTVSTVLQTMWDTLGAFVDVILAPILQTLGPHFQTIVEYLMNVANKVGTLVGYVSDILEFFIGLPGKIAEAIKKEVPGAAPVIEAVEKFSKGWGKEVIETAGIGATTWAVAKGVGKVVPGVGRAAGRISIGTMAASLLVDLIKEIKAPKEEKPSTKTLEQFERIKRGLGFPIEEWNYQLGGFVPKGGLYFLHRGEEVKTSVGRLGLSPVYVTNNFDLAISTATDLNALMRQISDSVTSSLNQALRRVR